MNPVTWKKHEGKILSEEDFVIPIAQQEQICKFYSIPGTLLNVDKKFGTSTFLDVLQHVDKAQNMQALVNDDGKILSIIDPKSTYITDTEFDDMIERLNKVGLNTTEEQQLEGATRKVHLDINIIDSDSFLEDVFKRRIMVERLASGGCYMSLDLLRLACTNGMLMSDKQFQSISRNKPFDDSTLTTYMSDMHAFSLKGYLENLWYKNGKMIQASVADFYGMRKTLADVVDSEVAELYFPTAPIEEHYAAQDIDVKEINNNLRSRMPAGVTYYDCFNILTNGVKQAKEYTLEDQIRVATWCKPSRIQQLKQSDISFSGVPHYDANLIKALKGDTALDAGTQLLLDVHAGKSVTPTQPVTQPVMEPAMANEPDDFE